MDMTFWKIIVPLAVAVIAGIIVLCVQYGYFNKKGSDETEPITNSKQTNNNKIIESKGIVIVFGDKVKARGMAFQKAMQELLSKFPKDKELLVRRYVQTIKDEIKKGDGYKDWEATIVLRINEADIIKKDN